MNPRSYAEAVINGKTLAGVHIQNAARRQLADLDTASEKGIYWDDNAAAEAVAFFETLLVMPDTGQHFELLDWQEFLIGNLFGWRRATDGMRRFRRVYLETAKGSGKSPVAAGIGIKAICADGRRGAEAYMIARTADQALVTFRHATRLIEATPVLADRLRIIGGVVPYRIIDPVTYSFLTRVASTKAGKGQSGALAHCVIIDEYHEHDDSAMKEMYDAATKSDPEPLVVMTTNAGVDLKSACGQEHQYAAKVADGTADDIEYLSLIYSVDSGDDPIENEEVWVKSNPSLPLLPGYDYIRGQARKAQGMPSKRSSVERLNFSRWVDSADPWLDPDVWRRCLIQEPLPGREDCPCYIGMDLSAKTDLTAGVVAWDHGDIIEVEVKVWTPEDTLDARAEADNLDYRAWQKKGVLGVTPGKIIDYSYPVAWIHDIFDCNALRAIAYDAWRIDLLENAIEASGLTTTRERNGVGIWMVPHPQGFVAGARRARQSDLQRELAEQDIRLWMPRSIDSTEEAILDGKLRVIESPPLNASVTSLRLVEDASGNRRCMKIHTLSRIDAAVAMIMAVGCLADFRRMEAAMEVSDISELVL